MWVGGEAQPAVQTCWMTGTDRDCRASKMPGQQRDEDLNFMLCLCILRGASHREHTLSSFMFSF